MRKFKKKIKNHYLHINNQKLIFLFIFLAKLKTNFKIIKNY